MIHRPTFKYDKRGNPLAEDGEFPAVPAIFKSIRETGDGESFAVPHAPHAPVRARGQWAFDKHGNALLPDKAAEVAQLSKVYRALEGGVSETLSFAKTADGWASQNIPKGDDDAG